MRNVFLAIFFCFFAFQGFLTGCLAQAAEISPRFSFARWGDKILGACVYNIPATYHAYSHSVEGLGLPTVLDFTLEGEGAMPVLYPAGVKEKDIYDPGKSVFVYRDRVVLLAVMPDSASGAMYAARLEMLLCSSKRCLPDKQTFTGQIETKLPLLQEMPWKGEAEALLASQADSFGAISVDEGKAPPPLKDSSKESASPPGGASAENGTDAQSGGIAGADALQGLNLSPTYANADMEIFTLGQALLLGLLAGLLLNAMPCVLPVLTIKVSGLVMMGNLSDKHKMRHFRLHNFFFALGILTFFTFLAILLVAADLMWGQLYQNQAVILVMLLLVFLMGLSMLGVFTLPVIDLHVGEDTKNPKLQAYCTGLVSTFLATPCSGPLLGGALAWALTQSMLIVLAVFWAIGFGMALPYITFCVWPNMARILPRPGNWMYVVEHILGFMLLATSIYLLSILPPEKHMEVLAILLVVACGAWLWGKFCGPAAPMIRRRMLGAACCVLLCCAIFWVLRPTPPQPQWQAFSPQTFMDSLGKKNMLVEFTADWCPNCKFIEATVFSARNVNVWRKRYGMELIKVDLTQPDPYAEKLLAMLGSKSIPLTALFAKGPAARKPLALRDIYTRGNLEKCLAKTFGDS